MPPDGAAVRLNQCPPARRRRQTLLRGHAQHQSKRPQAPRPSARPSSRAVQLPPVHRWARESRSVAGGWSLHQRASGACRCSTCSACVPDEQETRGASTTTTTWSVCWSPRQRVLFDVVAAAGCIYLWPATLGCCSFWRRGRWVDRLQQVGARGAMRAAAHVAPG